MPEKSNFKGSGRHPNGRTAAVALDGIDRRMLETLAADGRLSIAALAEKLGISRAGAYNRLERLQSEGVIEGFTIRTNPAKLGLGLTALVLVSGTQPAWRKLRRELSELPEVEYCAFVTGEHDALVMVRVSDIETLRDLILERIQTFDDVRATQTIFVLDEVVRRPLVLPRA